MIEGERQGTLITSARLNLFAREYVAIAAHEDLIGFHHSRRSRTILNNYNRGRSSSPKVVGGFLADVGLGSCLSCHFREDGTVQLKFGVEEFYPVYGQNGDGESLQGARRRMLLKR